MSPGTNVAACNRLPFAIAPRRRFGRQPVLERRQRLEALWSCQNSSAALKSSSAVMMTKSSQWPITADTTAAASIM